MKIAYVAFTDVSFASGVTKKIHSQIAQWLTHGHEAKLFAISPGQSIWPPLAAFPHKVGYCTGFLHCWRLFPSLTKAISQYGPDLIYLRYCVYVPRLAFLIKNFATVTEINTYDLAEFPVIFSRSRMMFHRLTRRNILSNVRGMIFVSGEVATHYKEFRKATTVIANGIDLSRYSCLPPAINDSPHLAFIGSAGYEWNGIDHVFQLARSCPEYRVHIIGIDAGRITYPIPKNVEFHGYLAREQYETILQQCDIAIGTLAFYRKQMNENSTLKFLEYMAYGIPTINGYAETELPSGSSYVLQIPNRPDGVEAKIARIRVFVDRWKGVRITRSIVEPFIDIRTKEERRLEFFANTCSA